MSTNAEIVSEAFRRMEAADFDAFGELWHADALSTAAEGWPEQGPFNGREAIVTQFTRLFADWSENEFQDIKILKDEGDWIVFTFVWETRGAGSGLAAHFDLAGAFLVEDGKVLEGHFRWNGEEALAAAAERAG